MPEEEGQLRLEIEDAVLHPDYAQQAYQDVAVVKLKAIESKLCFGSNQANNVKKHLN